MKISITQIKKLRSETGAGINDIKSALEEAKGDETKAKEQLRKKGFEKADKKASREIKAGRVFSYVHHSGTVGAMITLGCETDFVAKTDEFQLLGRELAMQAASMKPENKEEFLKQDYIRDPQKTIETLIKEVIAKTGENCQLLDFKRFEV
ncbi:MAG: elongation factor T [Microgenomates group bacterium Gr01-1014_5]|nr:MAG: elongation factor T [Microgenomates group bacterium Gr01-1014_5]